MTTDEALKDIWKRLRAEWFGLNGAVRCPNRFKNLHSHKGYSRLNDWCSTPETESKKAQLFCELEDCLDWIKARKAGLERHEKEMQRQQAAKVCRMQTYAAFADAKG